MYIYEEYFALNNQQALICQETQSDQIIYI